MGLDMNVYTRSESQAALSAITGQRESTELYYWRKHHDLHNWMEQLYRERGGEKSFNCIELRLDKNDLDRLMNDIDTGIFQYSDDEYLKDDQEFIQKARVAIHDGLSVYYNSWW